MKDNRKGRRLIGLVAMTLVVSILSGCALFGSDVEIEPMEVEDSKAISFDIIGGKDVMPIGGYYIPYSSTYSYNGNDLPNYISDEFYAMIDESGINFLAHSMTEYSTAPALVEENLDLGEKYGIAVFVDDSTIMGQAGREEVSKEEISIQLTNYMNHPAFAGLYITDEPTAEYTYNYKPDHTLTKYGTISRLLNDEIGVVGYVNAFHSGGTEKEKDVYEKYIEDFYNTLHPQYLSFDRYIFDAQHRDRKRNFFYEIDVLRKVSKKYEIPFWTFVGAGSQWNDDFSRYDSTTPYYPTEGEFDWSANVVLAFGAQGIQYFPLIQPHYYAWAESTEFDFERNGIFGAWGNKTQWYYYAQDLNKQIAAVDEVLMNAVNKGVIASGKQAKSDTAWVEEAMIEGTSWRELASVEGDALVGCFNYQGKTALYVANYSWKYAQKIDLQFFDKYQFTVVQGGQTARYEGKGITLDMFAGDGALVVFE